LILEKPRPARRRQLRKIAIAYLLVSVLAVVFSRPLLFVSGGAYLLLELALGPIGFLFNLWIYPVVVIVDHVVVYLAATGVLALFLLLMGNSLRFLRISAYVGAATVWIGCSGFIFWVEVLWGP